MITLNNFTKNYLFNIAGQAIPAILALCYMPALTSKYGLERIGFITIAWSILGYFSIFDFGISRSLTKMVAENKKYMDKKSMKLIIATGTRGSLILSFIGSAILYIIGHTIILNQLNFTVEVFNEAKIAWDIMSLTLPLTVVYICLRGALEGFQKFITTNFAGIIVSISSFLLPVLFFKTAHLHLLILSMAIGRIVGIIIFSVNLALILNNFKIDEQNPTSNLVDKNKFTSVGFWIMVSNIVSPLMINGDRLIMSMLFGPTTVAYYTVPFDALTKLLAIPSAVGQSLFPTLAELHRDDEKTMLQYIMRSRSLILIGISLPVFTIALFCGEILSFWLGSLFESKSTFIVQVLCIGIIPNALASPFFIALQATDHQKITGLCNLIELPCYIIAVLVLSHYFGIAGAAMAFSIRTSLDYLLLRYFSHRKFPSVNSCRNYIDAWTILITLSAVSILILHYFPSIRLKWCFMTLHLVVYGFGVHQFYTRKLAVK